MRRHIAQHSTTLTVTESRRQRHVVRRSLPPTRPALPGPSPARRPILRSITTDNKTAAAAATHTDQSDLWFRRKQAAVISRRAVRECYGFPRRRTTRHAATLNWTPSLRRLLRTCSIPAWNWPHTGPDTSKHAQHALNRQVASPSLASLSSDGAISSLLSLFKVKQQIHS